MSDLNRRDFVVAAIGAVCAGCMCEFAEGASSSTQMSGTVDIGKKSEYSQDGISDKFVKSDQVVVAREDGKIYAMSAICTHRRAIVTVSSNGNEIICKKHGSHFSAMGTPTKGPAKISLLRFAINENDKGHLIVDKSKQFEEKKWDDPAASVTA